MLYARTAVAVALAAGAMGVLAPPAGASNDVLFKDQWSLMAIGAPAAWATTTGDGVRIGIVDTGVDLHHEDLGAKVVAHTSCVGSAGDPRRCGGSGQDDQGHGTHVAGIAAATRNNGKGVAGVAPDAQLVVAKVLDARGSGNDADITAGIRWVVDHGAQVVNLSLGDPAFVITSLFGTSLREGIDYAWSKGAVPVLASGNTNLLGLGIGSSNYGGLPALVVGATDRRDRVSGYSSPLGTAAWGVVAPGGAGGENDADNVLSTWWERDRPDAYKALAGTSMATPHVSGTIALLLSQGLSPLAAVLRVLETANPAVSCGADSRLCRGRLDAAAAVAGATASGPAVPSLPAVEAVEGVLKALGVGERLRSDDASSQALQSAGIGTAGRSVGAGSGGTQPPPVGAGARPRPVTEASSVESGAAPHARLAPAASATASASETLGAALASRDSSVEGVAGSRGSVSTSPTVFGPALLAAVLLCGVASGIWRRLRGAA